MFSKNRLENADQFGYRKGAFEINENSLFTITPETGLSPKTELIRPSNATITDNNNIIRYSKENELRICNARRIENLFNIETFTHAGLSGAIFEKITLTEFKIKLGGHTNYSIRLFGYDNSVSIYNKTLILSVYLKGVGVDIGKQVKLELRRLAGDPYLAENKIITLTENYERHFIVLTGGLQHIGTQIVLAAGPTNPADIVNIKDIQIEDVTGSIIYNEKKNMLNTSDVLSDDWLKTLLESTTDLIELPDSTFGENKFLITSSSITQGISSPSIITDNVQTSYTFSIYIKQEGSIDCIIYFRNNIGSGDIYGRVVINTETGFKSLDNSSGTASYSLELINGWWRVSFTSSNLPINTMISGHVRLANIPVGTGISLYGGQLEESPEVTTYQEISNGEVIGNTPLIPSNYVSNGLLLSYGDNLVQNVDFSNGLTNWINSSSGSGEVIIEPNSIILKTISINNRGIIDQVFPTIIGNEYVLNFTFSENTGANTGAAWIGETSAGEILKMNGIGNNIYQTKFTATTETTNIRFYGTYNTGDIRLSNISIKELNNFKYGADGVYYETTDESYILIEEYKKNLINSYITNAEWSYTHASISDELDLLPDGTYDKCKLEITTYSLVQGISTKVFTNSSTEDKHYTFSIFVKKENNTRIVIYARPAIGSGTMTYGAITFDTVDGLITFNNHGQTSAKYNIIDLGNWWRISLTSLIPNDLSIRFHVRLLNQPVGNYIKLWGCQLEESDYLSSFIPNETDTEKERSSDLITHNLGFDNFPQEFNYSIDFTPLIDLTLSNPSNSYRLFGTRSTLGNSYAFRTWPDTTAMHTYNNGGFIGLTDEEIKIDQRCKYSIQIEYTGAKIAYNGYSVRSRNGITYGNHSNTGKLMIGHWGSQNTTFPMKLYNASLYEKQKDKIIRQLSKPHYDL